MRVKVILVGHIRPESWDITIENGQPLPRVGDYIWLKNPDVSDNNWLVKVNTIHHCWDTKPDSVQMFVSYETCRYC
jgi:hypothetical protein